MDNLDKLGQMFEGRLGFVKTVLSEVEKVENEGKDPSPYNRESVVPCCYCEKSCFGKVQPKLCGGCRGVCYCSADCQKRDWKIGTKKSQPHKKLCTKYQEYTSLQPSLLTTVESFPWYHIPGYQNYNRDLVLARFRILDSTPQKVGYWSQYGGFAPHDLKTEDIISQQFLGKKSKTSGYRDGAVLLDGKEWEKLKFQDGGWKLCDDEIYGPGGKLVGRDPITQGKIVPRLQFDANNPSPNEVPGKRIVDWDSWYRWRGLSKESPVALLMDFPLSVYWLITRVLGLVTEDELEWKGKPGEKVNPFNKRQLDIHYIGTEVELNFLPIFAELALLIPNVQITLTFFGPSVKSLLAYAKSHHPSSPASQGPKAASSRGLVVYEYSAPESLGGSTIQLALHGDSKYWDLVGLDIPDAVVALNSGIIAYSNDWQKAISTSWLFNVPFATTDYTHHDLDLAVEHVIQRMINQFEKQDRYLFPGLISILSDPDSDSDSTTASSSKPDLVMTTTTKTTSSSSSSNNSTFTITPNLNPFSRPGQRTVGGPSVPNMSNGFQLRLSGSRDPKFRLRLGGCGGLGLSLSQGLIPAKDIARVKATGTFSCSCGH